MTTMWIGDESSAYKVGDKGFLVKTTNESQGWERIVLRDTPAKTNRRFKPTLYGWCGSYNDVSTYGEGVGVVERVAKNGRAFVRVLEGSERLAVLEEYGYPELAND